MTEWKDFKLSDVLEIKNGKSRPNSIGQNPVYGGNGILGFSDKYNVKDETIVIGRVGAYCGSTYFTDEPIWVSDNALYGKAKSGFNPKYLYYLLKWDNLNKYAGGSSHPLLTQNRLNDLVYSLPPLPIQRRIASILSSLDDKIELNNAINKNLEELAQTLFKRWFVDFNFPMTAEYAASTGKPELVGQPYKDNGGEMVESELGMIPKGWEVVRFGDLVEKYIDNRGKTPPTVESGIPLVEVKHMSDIAISPDLKTDKFVDDSTYNTWFRAHLIPNDILMSTVGTIGRLNITPKGRKFAIAQNVLGLRFNKSRISQLYMFCLMRSRMFNDEINARLITTVQASIKRSDMETIPVLVPNYLLNSAFTEIINELFELMDSNKNEITELSALRDNLIPKLISGQIEIE